MARVATVAGGLVLLLGAVPVLWLGLFWAAMGLGPPDPTTPDGDPCCEVPRTWGEVIGNAAAGLVLTVLATTLLACGVALLRWGARRRRSGLARVALPPAAVGVLLAAGLALSWVLGEAP